MPEATEQASSGFLLNAINNVLVATDQIATRFDEGISAFMSGQASSRASSSSSSSSLGDDAGAAGEVPEFDPEDFEGWGEEEIEAFKQEILSQNGSPLEGIADSVIGDIVRNTNQPQTPMEHIQAFRSAITWSEPFICGLLAFQIFMMGVCWWATRKGRGSAARLSVLGSIAILVRSSEWLNRIGNRNWESFATQNYFDKRGIFMSTMLCGPLLIYCLVLLLCFVREASQLLIEVKTNQLKQKEARKKKGQEQSASSASGTAKKKRTNKKRD